MKRFLFFVSMMLALAVVSCKKEEPSGGGSSNTTPQEVKVNSVALDKSSLSMTVGETAKLTATVSPSDAKNKNIKWSSSSDAVASVGSDGTVTAKGAGSATITCTTEDGGKTATCSVTVKAANVAVTGVTLDKSSSDLKVGGTVKLTPTVAPADATNKTVKWTTSDDKVAKVANDGTVTGVAVGTATITCTTEDGSKTATCEVTVKEATVDVTEVSLDKTTADLTLGGSITLTPTVAPENATNQNVTWTSSDEEVATVTEDGTVTAVGPGTATITCTTEDGEKTASCTVTVTVPVSGVSLNQSKVTITIGSTYTLKPEITPENASDKSVTWTSSHTDVATVSEDGKVTALKVGTTDVLCTTNDGNKKAICYVTVTDKKVAVTGVTLDNTTLDITTGSTYQLVPTVAPNNATDKTVTWTSSKPDVATVSDDGTVTAKAVGSTTITCKTKDGNKTATCTVNVSKATVSVTGVTLDKTSLIMDIDGTYTLKATVAPNDADNKKVTWTTSDASIATVSSAGKVTALAKGSATITATTSDGGFKATCKVQVKDFRFTWSQGNGSTTMGPDTKTFTYIMGSNTQSLGDAMKFFLSDGTGYSYTDLEESHWKFTVVSNDGCIEMTKEKTVTGATGYYYCHVVFKKNGSAKIRLAYDNGVVKVTQDVVFNVYLDGSKKWKFVTYTPGVGTKDFSGSYSYTFKGEGTEYTDFQVTDLSGNAVEDLTKSHYTINDWWQNGTISTGCYSQQVHGRNYYLMFIYYEKKGSAYVELNYTDGVYMISTKNFSITVK